MRRTGLSAVERRSKKLRIKKMNTLGFQKIILDDALQLLVVVEISRDDIRLQWYRSLIHVDDDKGEPGESSSLDASDLGELERSVVLKLAQFVNEIPLEIQELETQLEKIIYDYNSKNLMKKLFESRNFKEFEALIAKAPREGQKRLEFAPYIKSIKTYPQTVDD